MREQLDTIASMLGRQLPKVETMLREAADDITASPISLCRSGRSLVNRPVGAQGIKRRTDVVGVFPTPQHCCGVAGSVLVEAHDEWQVADKRYLSETRLALLKPSDNPVETVAATAALTALFTTAELRRNARST